MQIPQETIDVLAACHVHVSDRLATLAVDEEVARLSCTQLLELAGSVAHAEWECEQAAGEPAADAGAANCRDLKIVLKKALDELLVGREVVVDDSWMMKDPDDDLERPTVHGGVITSWTDDPALAATVMKNSGNPMTASAHLWTVTDRTTRKVIFGMLS